MCKKHGRLHDERKAKLKKKNVYEMLIGVVCTESKTKQKEHFVGLAHERLFVYF